MSSTHSRITGDAGRRFEYDRNATLLPYATLRLSGTCCGAFTRGGLVPNHSSIAVLQHTPPGASPARAHASAAVIDFVVTYVNPFGIDKSIGGDPQRVRDWNELYWNLRSMFYHGRLCVFEGQPDRCLLGRIHLVVASRTHVPTWLSRRLVGPDANGTEAVELRFRRFLRERLNVVEHKDMFPPGTPYTEAYNSNVIELNLHRIPGLSPFYLYFNNDMFLGRELRLQNLFTPMALELMNDEYCDLIPITWYEPPEAGQRYPYPEAGSSGKISRGDGPSPTRSGYGLTEVERMIEFNIAILTSNYSVPFLQRRVDAGDSSHLPLLRYPHLPMLYDRSTIHWILGHPAIASAVTDSMTRPANRGGSDVWVPYLYINTKRLAMFSPSGAHDRLFQQVDASLYRFSMLTDTGAVSLEYHRIHPNGFNAELFLTLNDDFSPLISSNAADPSVILFDDSAAAAGTIVCGGNDAQENAMRAEQRSAGNWFAIKAVRTLLRMHDMYCRWEAHWAQNPNQ